jgi:hypothetical protein
MNKLAVRIMAVRSRKPMVDRLLAQLGMDESIVFYDDEGLGCIGNALRIWGTPLKDDESHLLVLQDDVEVVNNFVEIATKCINQFPKAIFGFFNYTLRYEDKQRESPYVLMKNHNVKGESMLIPKEYIQGYIDFYNSELRAKNYPHDDATCRMYALLNDIPVFSTIPCLVNNLCPVNSVMGHNDANHYSRVWEGYDVDVRQFETKEYSISRKFPIITHLAKDDPLNMRVKERLKRR